MLTATKTNDKMKRCRHEHLVQVSYEEEKRFDKYDMYVINVREVYECYECRKKVKK